MAIACRVMMRPPSFLQVPQPLSPSAPQPLSPSAPSAPRTRFRSRRYVRLLLGSTRRGRLPGSGSSAGRAVVGVLSTASSHRMLARPARPPRVSPPAGVSNARNSSTTNLGVPARSRRSGPPTQTTQASSAPLRPTAGRPGAYGHLTVLTRHLRARRVEQPPELGECDSEMALGPIAPDG